MSELFNGTWEIDLERSTLWDATAGRYVPDAVGQEIITIRVEGGVQDYEVLYGDDPVIRMGYTSRYDAPEWVPYQVREIIGVEKPADADSVAEFAARIGADRGAGRRDFTVGRSYGLVRTIYVDELNHYRASRNPGDGSVQAMMLRKMEPDGDAYTAHVLDGDGIVFRVRRFVRRDPL